MEWRPETGEYGNRRQTALRISGQFQSKRSKSLRRLHRNAKSRGIDPRWQSNQGPRVRLLTNYEEIENELSVEIIRPSNCCAHHHAGIGWRRLLVALL